MVEPAKPPRRVMIIGGPGSGKSTLAKAIGARWDLPVYHLDALFWQPGWVEPDKAVFHDRVRNIAATEAWVMEGNYTASWPERAARADRIYCLEVPMPLRLYRAVRRSYRYRGKVRPDIAPGCPERLNWAFMHFVVTYGGSRRRKSLDLCAAYPEKASVLKGKPAVADLA